MPVSCWSPWNTSSLASFASIPNTSRCYATPRRFWNGDYTPEMGQTNPFLHMGMHIAIQEQLGSNRPDGIRDVYRQICRRSGDAHAAEHLMMECLGETLWEAQRTGMEPDERVYLERLRRLTKRT